MRIAAMSFALALGACAASQTATLVSADPATTLIAGERITMIHAAGGLLSLRHGDGRVMTFQHSNHTEMDAIAQAPDGPLAQIMGLFAREQPTLYGARSAEHRGAPFICGPEGPVSLGVYEARDGAVQIVGLEQRIMFDRRPDGAYEPIPYSPDQVCARLRFRKR